MLYNSKFFIKPDQVATAIVDVTARLLNLESKAPIRLAIAIGANNAAIVDLTAYKLKLVPKVDQILYFNANNQVFIPVVTSVTSTQLVVSGRRSKGTLLLTAGPFEPCVAGDIVYVWVLPQ